MIVLDASAALTLLAGSPPPAASAVRERVHGAGESIHAPHLIDLEILNALRRWVRRGPFSPSEAATILERLAELRLVRYPHDAFRGRIWDLRGNLTAYDAAYVALAEALQAPLLTLDARLAKAVGSTVEVELV